MRGCCPLDCQDTCSWVAHVEEGRVVRVEGAKDHPFTRGALCAKVNDYEQRVYAPDRLLHPLRRSGPKGSGEFDRISWDEALDFIASGFLAIIDESGAEAILPLNYLGSMGVVQRRALMRIFHALGASRLHGSICGAAGNVLAEEGHPRGFDPEEIVHSRLVLLWGANLLSTSHHHWHFVDRARRQSGARIVCIDPIRTRTARACDEHVMLKPGSDAVLAAGIAHVLFAEELADVAFARSAVVDLDAFREQVVPWTPERVSAVCGVEADVVVRLAREYGAAHPATIRCGIAPQQTRAGESFVRALAALAIVGGHWRHRGGGLFIEANPVLSEASAARPDLLPRETRSLDMARLGEQLTSIALEPPIRALMVWNHNPAVTQPDSVRVREGLAREDLLTVVVEHFLTDTARYADVVLPSTTQLEHFDIVGAWGHHYISLNEPAVPPQGEALSHGEIMRRLAPRLGLDHPAFRESDEEIAETALPDGIGLSTLRENGWYKTTPPPPAFGDGSARLTIAGEVPLPASAPAADMLQLLTPKSHYFLNSSFANMGRQRTAMKRPTLEMHAADAAMRGLLDAEEVEIANERAAIRAWLRITEDICPGVVALAGKWWGDAEGNPVANLLTASAWSPGGQPAYNDTFVRINSVQPPAFARPSLDGSFSSTA
ncbi:molybdopterin-dependent oxidoreductase [Gaiella sp.]|uniref:molybdopterin-containing oxidoreductase family protein n=1 Tax=Gaiella sp. TaxID=2663207 RepID=UPI003982E9F0